MYLAALAIFRNILKRNPTELNSVVLRRNPVQKIMMKRDEMR